MPRVIVPVLLLAASLGSARTAIADKPVSDDAGYPIVGNAMTKGGPPRRSTQPVTVAAPSDEAGYPVVGNAMSKTASPPPRLTVEQQRARTKLRSTSPEFVRADLTPYLPLCDAAGYPLVGNASGSSKTARMQPSQMCTLVREDRARAVRIAATKPAPTAKASQ